MQLAKILYLSHKETNTNLFSNQIFAGIDGLFLHVDMLSVECWFHMCPDRGGTPIKCAEGSIGVEEVSHNQEPRAKSQEPRARSQERSEPQRNKQHANTLGADEFKVLRVR